MSAKNSINKEKISIFRQLILFIQKQWKYIVMVILGIIVIAETILILTFLNVTTSFHRVPDYGIDFPTSQKNSEVPENKRIELVIDREGKYYTDGLELKEHNPETLFHALVTLSESKEVNPVLIIKADASLDYQTIVTAMDVASRAGLLNISLETVQTNSKDTN